MKNVGLSKAVYLLLENTKIDAVALTIIPTAKQNGKKENLVKKYIK